MHTIGGRVERRFFKGDLFWEIVTGSFEEMNGRKKNFLGNPDILRGEKEGKGEGGKLSLKILSPFSILDRSQNCPHCKQVAARACLHMA